MRQYARQPDDTRATLRGWIGVAAAGSGLLPANPVDSPPGFEDLPELILPEPILTLERELVAPNAPPEVAADLVAAV